MKKKLNCILLIEDDKATNFIHQRIIKRVDCAEKVVTALNGLEALEYLNKEEDGVLPQPDLIFLDINMPGMNGWEFLEEYQKLHNDKKGKVILVMLTTSLNPDDFEKASQIPEVNGFKNKPLTMPLLESILEEYFQDHF
ncbi:response regulator [Gillisia sp. M10.2A]|uniref:Response regulator n=1 Tax=Gillisia lutea TaxID=2909668 RepID=A0ABS9EHW2_9FLAO|nr:response regulator [Gillisia lutea]MCF4101917.1 response regulator [Gillisia lutea]